MRYFLDPFGCVKNQVDAENMMAYLGNAGWEYVTDAELADLIIVNSCGFIDSAKQESIDAVIQWRKHFPEKKILLAGCLSQRYAKELPESLTEADVFMGVENIAQVTEKAADAFSKYIKNGNDKSKIKTGRGSNNSSRLKQKQEYIVSQGERPLLSLPGSAYVKISEGCSNHCSYCAIPLIRGSLVSRSIPDILEECRILLSRGIRELCIIGQDIGAYGTEKLDVEKNSKLPELLNAISTLNGHFWVRLLYLHPDHFPMQIIDLIEKDNRFLPYFDIPFQHASPKILAFMNRQLSHQNKTSENYLDLLHVIRSRLPHAVIRSTFMLGFPGETEDDFAMLLDFQEKACLDWLGCFTYSREEGTASYSMKGRVPKKIALARKKLIEEKQIPITEKKLDCFTGQTMEVLTEEKIINDSEIIWLGRLYCQAPDIDGAAVIISGKENGKNLQAGNFTRCKIIARRGFDLEVRAL